MAKVTTPQGRSLEWTFSIIRSASLALELALSARNSVLESITKSEILAQLCEHLLHKNGDIVVAALAVLLGSSKGMDKKANQIRTIFDAERKDKRPQIHIEFRDNTINIENLSLHQHEDADQAADDLTDP